jgi:hypothetical protein
MHSRSTAAAAAAAVAAAEMAVCGVTHMPVVDCRTCDVVASGEHHKALQALHHNLAALQEGTDAAE